MIRVCIVAPAWMTGGQAVEARTLVEGFADSPDVQVCLQPIDPTIPEVVARIKGLRTLVRLPLFYAGLCRRVVRADVVHVFTAAFWPFLLTTTPAVLLARLLGRPVILNYRDGRARDHIRHGVVRWILRRASILAFPSGFLRDTFAEFGIYGVVVPNVVDLRRFRYRQRHSLRPVLLSARLLEDLYAVENTILAFEHVKKEYPDARLLVVGDGHCRRDLERLVDERDINGVEFIGRVTHADMGRWYHAADILVNSSREDNMPHCLIEAFAAGLPVVTTGAGGIPYIVQHERNGLHVACDDPASMSAAVLRLLRDWDLADRLIEMARSDAERLYSWTAAQEQWVGLYAELLQRRAAMEPAPESEGGAVSGH